MVAIARRAADDVASELVSRRLGLIVNPVAGLGGRVGLKGTDGREIVRRALELGAQPVAPVRADRALARLERHRDGITIVAGARAMGGDAAREHGFETRDRRRRRGDLGGRHPRRSRRDGAAPRRPDPVRRRRRHDPRHRRRGRHPRADPRHPDRREDALRRLRDEPGGRGRPRRLAVRARRGRGDGHRRGGAPRRPRLGAALRRRDGSAGPQARPAPEGRPRARATRGSRRSAASSPSEAGARPHALRPGHDDDDESSATSASRARSSASMRSRTDGRRASI